MGAGASFPEEGVNFQQAQSMAGEQWDEKLAALWPEGKETLSKEELLHLVRDVPCFAKKNPAETAASPQTWDETPVQGAQDGPAAEASVAVQMQDEAQAPATVKAKVEVAPREKLDTQEIRLKKLAEQNNTTVEEVAQLQNQALPPKPKRKKGKKQSSELRQMMREQRKAARAGGRPMSRGLSEMECQLLVKEPGEGAAGKSGSRAVIVLGDVDPNKPASSTPLAAPAPLAAPLPASVTAGGAGADPATE